MMSKANPCTLAGGLLLFALSCCCRCLELSVEYIEMPFLERGFGVGDNGRIFEMLNSVQLKAQSSPSDVLVQLQRFRAEKARQMDRLDAENLDKLIGLAVDNENECGFGQFSMFVKVLLMMKRTKKIALPQLFLAYLEHYGRRRFIGCAENVIAEFESKLERERENVEEINDFFKTGFSLDDEKDPGEKLLLVKLKQFDLAHVAEDMADLVHEDLEKLPLVEICDRLTSSFDNDFNVLNLARIFNPSEDYFEGNVQLEKLNEVHRICVEWQRETSRFARS